MAKFEYIGWFTFDPFDATQMPYTEQGHVTAPSMHVAFDKALAALEKVVNERSHPPELMNWYVRQVRR